MKTLCYGILAMTTALLVISFVSGSESTQSNNIDDILNQRVKEYQTLFQMIEVTEDGKLTFPKALETMRLSSTSGELLNILNTIVESSNNLHTLSGEKKLDGSTSGRSQRQKVVMEATKYGMSRYFKYALGADNLLPLNGTASNAQFDLAGTLIDSFDTQMIMGLDSMIEEQLDYVKNMDLNPHHQNFFLGDIITVLGGLLGADYTTDNSPFLSQAGALGEILLKNYEIGINSVPYPDFDSFVNKGVFKPGMPDITIIAELGLQLEFNQLAHALDEPSLSTLPQALVTKLLKKAENLPLIPIYYNPKTEEYVSPPSYTIGRFGDGFYEYIVKQYVQTGATDENLKEYFTKYYDNVIATLVDYTPAKTLYTRQVVKGEYANIFDELACFVPGNLMLAADRLLRHEASTEDIKRAKVYQGFADQLMTSCYHLFRDQPTGLCADEVEFVNGEAKSLDSVYKLRPETMESLYYMWYYTHDRKYQDWGWEIIQSVLRNCRAEYGWAYISDVTVTESEVSQLNLTGPYFYAELMKYSYLLFSENPQQEKINLEDYVFNTEGHPMKIFTHDFVF